MNKDKDKNDKNKDKKEDKTLEVLLDGIYKQYGEGAIFVGLDSKKIVQCPAISTRCIALDLALGIGGVPRGRVIEIFGPEASGKTTLAATIAAQAQAEGDLVAYLDVEHALDPIYMRRLGCDLKRMWISQPDYGEQALDICERLVKSNRLGVIVIDSVAALVPKAELDGEIGDSFIALQARLMSQALRKLTGIVAKTKTSLIFINQIREKVGVRMMPGQSNEVTPGGRALKFYASVRMDIRRTGSLSVGGSKDKPGDKIGNEVRVKVIKNKVAPPFKEAQFVIVFGKGISSELSVLDVGTKFGIIEKTGNWLGYNGARLGQGRIDAMNFLISNPDLTKEITNKTYEIALKSREEDAGVPESSEPENPDEFEIPGIPETSETTETPTED